MTPFDTVEKAKGGRQPGAYLAVYDDGSGRLTTAAARAIGSPDAVEILVGSGADAGLLRLRPAERSSQTAYTVSGPSDGGDLSLTTPLSKAGVDVAAIEKTVRCEDITVVHEGDALDVDLTPLPGIDADAGETGGDGDSSGEAVDDESESDGSESEQDEDQSADEASEQADPGVSIALYYEPRPLPADATELTIGIEFDNATDERREATVSIDSLVDGPQVDEHESMSAFLAPGETDEKTLPLTIETGMLDERTETRDGHRVLPLDYELTVEDYVVTDGELVVDVKDGTDESDPEPWTDPSLDRDERVARLVEALGTDHDFPVETTATRVADELGPRVSGRGVVWSIKALRDRDYTVTEGGKTDEGATVWAIDTTDEDADDLASTIEIQVLGEERVFAADAVVDAIGEAPNYGRLQGRLGVDRDTAEALLEVLDLRERFEAEAPIPAGEVRETVQAYLDAQGGGD